MSRPKGSKNKATTGTSSKALAWLESIKSFCEKKGFPPSELIEKYEELEAKLAERTGSCNLSDLHSLIEAWDIPKVNLWLVENGHDKPVRTQNKPQISPETGLPANPSKNQHKAKNGAENKPSELSPFLKSRQADKNNMK